MNASPNASESQRLQEVWLSRGWPAVALLPLALLFALASGTRRWLYRLGWLAQQQLDAPVIVVGNLVAGGAGKTPAVIAVAELLRRRGYTPGIVSRGYGRRTEGLVDVRRDTPAAQCGDEPLLLHLRTRAPVLVGRDRVAAGRALLRAHPEVNVVISDDGLQHLALARQAQVLVFDERGIGNGWLLPAGPLRQRLPSRAPPRTVVLYNAQRPSTPLPGGLAMRSLSSVARLGAWWQGQAGSSGDLQALKGRPLVAAAGLARPNRFFDMLRDSGLSITTMALPDHYDFHLLPWPPTTPDVIVTEKDAVKLDPARMGTTSVWVAALDWRLPDSFETELVALLPHPPSAGNNHGSALA